MSTTYQNDPAWEPGKIYTYTLSVKSTGLALDGFTVVGWKTDDKIDDTTI